jgi:HPt (histidine-containing phosphotransfer) domain-containing protein
MDDFLSKPVEPDILARKIQIYLEEKVLHQILNRIEPNGVEPGNIVEDSIELDETVLGEDLSQSNGAQSFNKAKLSERFGNDEELIQVVLDAFLEEAPELIVKLKTALDNEDMDLIRAHAHALKGSAANVNADILKEMALDLEQDANQGQLVSISQILSDIEQEFHTFAKEVMS